MTQYCWPLQCMKGYQIPASPSLETIGSSMSERREHEGTSIPLPTQNAGHCSGENQQLGRDPLWLKPGFSMAGHEVTFLVGSGWGAESAYTGFSIRTSIMRDMQLLIFRGWKGDSEAGGRTGGGALPHIQRPRLCTQYRMPGSVSAGELDPMLQPRIHGRRTKNK